MRQTALLAVVLLGCPGTPTPPGDQQMGRYTFVAEFGDGTCNLVEIPDGGGFSFEANFSRFRDAGLYYVSIGGVAHDATWDGQKITAEYSAQRNFTQCQCPGEPAVVVTMTEKIVATIVSQSQSEAAGGCVDDPPFDPDAGILRPDTTAEGGFDAVRACGKLTEFIQADRTVSCNAPATCNGCNLTYAIQGERR